MATDLKARTLRVEEFPSGTVYGYVLPDVARMLYSGIFPTPVLAIMKESLTKIFTFPDRELAAEEQEAYDKGRALVVAWMIRAVDGEDTKVKPELIMDAEAFPDDDFTGLWMRALRIIAAPKATKEPSP